MTKSFVLLIKNLTAKRSFYFFYLLLSFLLLSELALRVASKKRGQTLIFFNRYTVSVPRSLADWEKALNRYTDNYIAEKSYYKYDSLLGWSVNPNSISGDSLYISNGQGIRSVVNFSSKRDSSTLRIAIFGDSFTEGFGVHNDETWPNFLEKYLIGKDIKAEVLNYGVAGYGIDQAYLRWKSAGNKMNPDIVVLGLNWGNFWRNLNIFRPILFNEAGILLTKPRGIIRGDSLCWKNIPTIDPKYILDSVVDNFSHSELSKYEYFNSTSLYSENVLNNSYFYLFMRHLLVSKPKAVIKECPEGQALLLQLIATFAKEVNSNGADFILLHLLQPADLERIKNGEPLYYQKILTQIMETYSFCSTGNLLKKYDAQLIYAKETKHPNAFANKLIGRHFAEFLIQEQNIHNLSPSNVK